MDQKESNVIVSWKEIARYFGSGVRTVQRWEHDCGLPVHRPSGRSPGTVLAIKSELDQWATQCAMRAVGRAVSPGNIQISSDSPAESHPHLMN